MAQRTIQRTQPKPGQPAKGGKRSTWRTPEDHYAVYELAYREAGFTCLSDYTAFVMARFHDLESPDFVLLRPERGPDDPVPGLEAAGHDEPRRRMRMAG